MIETLRSIRALTSEIPEKELTNTILLRGLELEAELNIGNLFDCLYAAATLRHDSIIVSDDKFYDSIKNLKRTSLRKVSGNEDGNR